MIVALALTSTTANHDRRDCYGRVSDQNRRKKLQNSYFRQVLFTGLHSQLVVMALAPGEEIGMETHNEIDQFIRVDESNGKAILTVRNTL